MHDAAMYVYFPSIMQNYRTAANGKMGSKPTCGIATIYPNCTQSEWLHTLF